MKRHSLNKYVLPGLQFLECLARFITQKNKNCLPRSDIVRGHF